MSGSPRTATRVTPGAICLSSSGHFPLMPVFEKHEAGGVAARVSQTFDEATGDWIGDDREHDRHRVRHLRQLSDGIGTSCQDYVRRERHQFRRLSANLGGIGGPVDVDLYVAALGPA